MYGGPYSPNWSRDTPQINAYIRDKLTRIYALIIAYIRVIIAYIYALIWGVSLDQFGEYGPP